MSIFASQSAGTEIRLSPGQAPRRRGDRELTPGRCGNLDYCSIGMQRVLVQVPVSQPFICPECGGRLRPPGSRWRRKPPLLPTLRIAVLLLCCAGSAGLGYMMGQVQPVVARTAQAGLKQAGTMIGVVSPPKPPPIPVVVAAKPPAPKPAPPILVQDVPYPAHAAAPDITDRPQRLPHEARFGEVTIDCLLPSANVTPRCTLGDARGGDAFSTAALAWLGKLAVDYAPGVRHGQKMRLDHRWRITFQDYDAPPPK